MRRIAKVNIKVEWFSPTEARYILFMNSKRVGLVNVRNEQVYDLFIDKKYRRKRLATTLMKKVIEDFGHEDLTLEAEKDYDYDNYDNSNISSAHLRKFYRKIGFVSNPHDHNYMYRKGTLIT